MNSFKVTKNNEFDPSDQTTILSKKIQKVQKATKAEQKSRKITKAKSWHTGQQFLTKFISVKTQFSSTGDGKIPDDTILISCWNINGLRAMLGKPHLIDYFKQRSPDIICFNETKVDKDSLENETSLFTKWIPETYSHYFNCSKIKKGYAGTAIISKYKPLSVQYGIEKEQHDSEGRVVTLEFETFFLVCVYVPNSGRHLERNGYRTEEWDPAFREYLCKLKDRKDVLVCGDFNVACDAVDRYSTPLNDPKKLESGYTPREREEFKSLLNSGFVDTFRHLHPEEKKYSWWSNFDNKRSEDKGWRVDYFLASTNAVQGVTDSMINKEIIGSDHCPVELVYRPNYSGKFEVES